MKTKHWLRIAAIALTIGAVAYLLLKSSVVAILLTLISLVAIPLLAMTVWSKRHRGD